MSRRQDQNPDGESEDLKGFDDFDLLLGDIMRGERATMGKSLLDVQRELRIKANYIAAIENTDPSAFETPGFIAGYVRSYARYLGLDPEWAFKTFCDEGNFTVAHGMSADASVRRTSQTNAKSKSKTRSELKNTPAHLRDPFTEPSVSYLPRGEAVLAGIEPRAIGSIVVLMALVAGIGYGGWAVLQEVQKVRFTPVDQTPEVLAELDPIQSALPPEEDSDVATIAPTTTAFDRLYRPEALDVPVMTARDGPIASINPDTIGALAPSNEERVLSADMPRPDNLPFSVPGTKVEPPSGPDDVVAALNAKRKTNTVQVVEDVAPSVSLIAVRPSWVRVSGSDGTVVFEKILDAGETFDVPLTENPHTLRAGNAGSLYFTVNGKTYGPAGDGPAVIKNVALSPEALQDTYNVADLSNDADLARFVAVAEASGASD